MWLRQALLKRQPITEEELELPTIELMEMWTDVPDPAVVQRINDNYRNVSRYFFLDWFHVDLTWRLD